MLVSNKFANILGKNFECLSDPPPSTCPMEVGQEPHLDTKTGEYQCPLCLYVVGTQSADDEESQGEDIIDEEEARGLGLVFVPETDSLPDQSDEESRLVTRKNDIAMMVSLIISIDRPYIEYMSNNQQTILTMLKELEDAKVKGFQTGVSVRPKILAVASHLYKRLPNSKALNILGVKTNDILKKKSFLDQTYTAKIDNKVSMAINDIGQSLDIPDVMISKAIEEYEKDLPPNREPKDRVKGAAWLYVYLIKKTDAKKVTRKQFTSLPGVSRVSFGKAVSVYLSYF